MIESDNIVVFSINKIDKTLQMCVDADGLEEHISKHGKDSLIRNIFTLNHLIHNAIVNVSIKEDNVSTTRHKEDY